jgi:hypothetical protein
MRILLDLLSDFIVLFFGVCPVVRRLQHRLAFALAPSLDAAIRDRTAPSSRPTGSANGTVRHIMPGLGFIVGTFSCTHAWACARLECGVVRGC